MIEPKQLAYNVEQAVGASGMTRTRLYSAIADGSLKSFKAGRRRMVSAKALQEFIMKLERESCTTAAA